MNSKLLLGSLGFCSIISVFVACGSGSIDPYSVDDQVAAISIVGNLNSEESKSACLADPVCKADYEGTVNPPSSAVIPASSSSYYSSGFFTDPNQGISSGGLIQISSGGSVPPIQISSSSGPVVVVQTSGDVTGSCAPTPAVAELGQQVTWTFTKGPSESVANVTNASYDWVFQGGSEPVFNGQGAFGVTKTISYGTSGSHTTTLAINGGTPMTCSPVQINGAPITGCQCALDNASPDVALGGVANWGVDNCVSTANIVAYSWDNLPASTIPVYTHVFTAKGETKTPTVNVYNDDNTIQSVVCPEAKAVDKNIPDYVLDGTAAGTYTLEAGTYSMQYACNGSAFHQPSINISASGVWENFNVIYSTSLTPAGVSPSNSQHNISFTQLFGSWPADNKVPTEMISITTDHAFVVKCQ